MRPADIYISVQDGDITVWWVKDRHAYPFESMYSLMCSHQRAVSNDEAFEALRTSDDAWWDRTPEPLGGAS